jgi:hypothetical protein
MMDIVNIIESKLLADICPVYTPSDAERDIQALKESLGIKVYACPERKKASYIYSEASEILHLSKDQWDSLCKSVDIKTFTRKKKLRLDAECVRRKILNVYYGDCAQWLANIIGCSVWFARILLPISAYKPVPVQKFQIFWSLIKNYQDSNKLRSTLTKYWKSDIEKDCFQNTIQLKNVLDVIRYQNVYQVLVIILKIENQSQFAKILQEHIGQDYLCWDFRQTLLTIKKAELLIGSAKFVTSIDIMEQCIIFIVGLKDIIYEDLCAILIPELQTKLSKLTEEEGLDFSEDEMTFCELCNALSLHEDASEIRQKYNSCGLIPQLEFDYLDHFPEVIDVIHTESGLNTSVLAPLYSLFDIDNEYNWYENDPIKLCNRFERYVKLKNALKNVDIDTIRNDSRVCAEYVILGTYSGACDPSCIDILENVVAMMIEMKFLFEKTDYSRFMKNVRNTDKAKELAIRRFINEINDSVLVQEKIAKLPHRLAINIHNHGIHPLTENEETLRDIHYNYYDSDSDSNYSNDSTFW